MKDRPGLLVAAHQSYGLPEDEYARLIDGVKNAEPMTRSFNARSSARAALT